MNFFNTLLMLAGTLILSAGTLLANSPSEKTQENPAPMSVHELYFAPIMPKNATKISKFETENAEFFFLENPSAPCDDDDEEAPLFTYHFALTCYSKGANRPYAVYTLESSRAGTVFFCAFVAGAHQNFGQYKKDLSDRKAVLATFLDKATNGVPENAKFVKEKFYETPTEADDGDDDECDELENDE